MVRARGRGLLLVEVHKVIPNTSEYVSVVNCSRFSIYKSIFVSNPLFHLYF
jgi:hypothetical protein